MIQHLHQPSHNERHQNDERQLIKIETYAHDNYFFYDKNLLWKL